MSRAYREQVDPVRPGAAPMAVGAAPMAVGRVGAAPQARARRPNASEAGDVRVVRRIEGRAVGRFGRLTDRGACRGRVQLAMESESGESGVICPLRDPGTIRSLRDVPRFRGVAGPRGGRSRGRAASEPRAVVMIGAALALSLGLAGAIVLWAVLAHARV